MLVCDVCIPLDVKQDICMKCIIRVIKQMLYERLEKQKALATDLAESVHQQSLFTGIETGSHFSIVICKWV